MACSWALAYNENESISHRMLAETVNQLSIRALYARRKSAWAVQMFWLIDSKIECGFREERKCAAYRRIQGCVRCSFKVKTSIDKAQKPTLLSGDNLIVQWATYPKDGSVWAQPLSSCHCEWKQTDIAELALPKWIQVVSPKPAYLKIYLGHGSKTCSWNIADFKIYLTFI